MVERGRTPAVQNDRTHHDHACRYTNRITVAPAMAHPGREFYVLGVIGN